MYSICNYSIETKHLVFDVYHHQYHPVQDRIHTHNYSNIIILKKNLVYVTSNSRNFF